MACCIYARDYILSNRSESRWFIHLRADSSPKAGRDFFVSEYDYCQLGVNAPYVSSLNMQQLLGEGRFAITTRILPLGVVGSRAASAAHKGQLLLRALSQESADLKLTVSRTVTMLFDFGAEAGIWSLPDTISTADGGDGQPLNLTRMFPLTLPLADADHSLHHVPWLVLFVALSGK